MQKPSLGWTVLLSLIALRVGIGMHFFREGLNKLRDPKPFSAGFFGNAQGPFAATFQAKVWDRDGLARLDQEKTLPAWDQFRAQAERQFGFDDKQKQAARDIQQRAEGQLADHFDKIESDLAEYRNNLARRDRYRAERERMETPSLKAQVDKLDSELATKRQLLVGPIDAIWQGYARDINAVATSTPRGRAPMALEKPGRRWLDSEGIDKLIPWFDATIGVLLILGFLTRPAALVGAAFLLSVIASQWPTTSTAIATWPQFIELLGLLVVAAIGAGRFAGCDGLLSAFCCGTKTKKP